jgi:hypothetical protein
VAFFLAVLAQPLFADTNADLAWVEKRVQEWQPGTEMKPLAEWGTDPFTTRVCAIVRGSQSGRLVPRMERFFTRRAPGLLARA